MVQVKFYHSVEDAKIRFAVIVAQHDGKWVFCRHKDRDTYEVAGGHREGSEQVGDTARRELYEETGELEFDLLPVSIYSVTGKNRVNDTGEETFGMLYYAEIYRFGDIPPGSEMKEVHLFPDLPAELTYPIIQPKLIERVLQSGYGKAPR